MQRQASDNPTSRRQTHKRSKLDRRKSSASPLKQRMEEVLKADRRAIHEPLAHLQATYFAN